MTDADLSNLNAIFERPERYLGTVEANVEVKVVLPFLIRLGWNVTLDIALCFQIERTKIGEGARAAHAADFALRKEDGLVAVGEVKQWHAGTSAWADGEAQVRRYQRALRLPRAFLTTGQRWLVLGAAGEVLFDRASSEPATLIRELGPVLGPGSIPDTSSEEADWAYGLRPVPSRSAEPSSSSEDDARHPLWDPLEYSDMDVKHRVERLISLSERTEFQRVQASKALMLRFPSRQTKLLEYRPYGPNIDVAVPRADLAAEGVPQSLIDEYAALAKALRSGHGSFEDLEVLLTRIIDSVRRTPLPH